MTTFRRIRWRAVLLKGQDDVDKPPDGDVRLDDGMAAVRALRRRSGILLLVGLVLLVGFMTLVDILVATQDELLAYGVRTPGVVVDASYPSRGGGLMDVRFTIADAERVRSISLNDESPVYRPGDQVTVVYDPADPERIRTDAEENEPFWLVFPLVVALVAGLARVSDDHGVSGRDHV